ncbi:MAG: thrombospondin type 3 repeat-containing protein [Planctomycetes bacterium]|nr:thrombospondin type 3 repeat-containing protein [Planctomycetota bacterium]
MTVRKTHCNGGTWESLLPVQAKFTFTNVQNPSDTRILDTGLAGQPPDMLTVSPTDDTPWVTDLDPNMTIEGGPTDFHPGIEDPNQPSACDCNLNGQRDSCDIEQGTSEDCQPNGVPDECDPDTDGDGIPDGCDNCPDHPNSIQADNNGDGVGDACAPQACCLSGGVCMDLPPPDCSTLGGAAQGTGTNCLTVVCPSICPPTPADPPHDRRKNRYLSFKPCSTNPAVKYKLTRVYPPPATDMGWVGAPDANGISAVLPDALKPPVRMWNEPVVHAGDCEIYPVPDTANTPLSCSLSGASCTQLCGTGQCPPGQGECMAPPTTYEIRATADNVNFSPPLTVTTVPRPCPKKWGDTVGDFAGGSWTAPNGVANVNDFLSTLQCFQVLPTRPHVSVCDVVGAGMMGFEACINKAGNIGDVFNLIKAFQGGAYPAYVCSISGHGCSNLGGACAAPGVGMCVIPDGTNCPACP